jgi:hypothetical protein
LKEGDSVRPGRESIKKDAYTMKKALKLEERNPITNAEETKITHHSLLSPRLGINHDQNDKNLVLL